VSLRLRLALWYGGLSTIVIVLLAGVVYLIHGRSLYDDIDRELANDAAHFAPVFGLVSEAREAEFTSRSVGQTRTFVRLYDDAGRALIPADETGAPVPPIDALEAAAAPGESAYTDVLNWLPGEGITAPGSFVTVDDASGRVRVYVLPIENNGAVTGYVQTWSSLASVDRSATRFRLLLVTIGAIGVVGVGVAGYAVSGPAVHPIGTMTHTAEAIARSRNFSRRIPLPTASGSDELGELARTFNEMLQALEASFTAQRRFMADAAHELRAPLTVLRGNLELLERVYDMPEEERRAALESLHNQSRRVSRLVDELLLLAQSDVGQTLREEPVELHEVVTNVVGDMRALPGGGRIKLDDLTPIIVTGDGGRLRQLVSGLLDNARKYTPSDSQIHVSLSERRGQAVLVIADNGPGISSEDLAHVFERFYRGEHARSIDPEGAGLGLAIARAIVEQHQGDISVESMPGHGVTVTIHLPVARTVAKVPVPSD